MNNGELSLKKILEIVEQIVFALSAAHSVGIVHRDLKPDNVMIRADGIVKVLDFGLVKLTENGTNDVDAEAETRALLKTKPGTIMGTVAYMSPEQARGKDTDARSDIFSIGVVLYEMATGRLPFQGETTSDVIAAILKTQPVPPSDYNHEIPGEFERISLKTLAKDLDERYQTAKDLLVDLRRLKTQAVVLAEIERAQSPQNTDRKAENATQILRPRATNSNSADGRVKRRSAAIASVFVLLVALTGFGYWYVGNRSLNSKQIESIAVLPFVNESGNADVEYLSDGMTETLIGTLSKLPNLNVKARSSVFRYKGKETDLQTIAKELNVQAILNGRIVQRGDQLPLNLELIDAQTENVIWSEQ